MELKVIRVGNNKDASISNFYIDGRLICGGIEDEPRTEKKAGETRVPPGVYQVDLRNEGGYNSRYLDKYGADFHKGMLCIFNRPNWVIESGGMSFQYILIHTGNTEKHTAGCYLPNYGIDYLNYTGNNSGRAYKHIYQIVRDAILRGEPVTIEYIDQD